MRAVVAAVDCPVTMKMRLGWSESDLAYLDVARRAQDAGVQAVTLHARTAKQFYRGNADWEHIARLKRGDRHSRHRQRRSRRRASRDAAHARERRRRDHARARDARQSVAHLADRRSDGRPRSAAAARRRPIACALRSCTTARCSTTRARRAPFRRCASTSRSISKGFRARRSCASASCTSTARTMRSRVIEETIARLEVRSDGCGVAVIESRDDLYGASSPEALAPEVTRTTASSSTRRWRA